MIKLVITCDTDLLAETRRRDSQEVKPLKSVIWCDVQGLLMVEDTSIGQQHIGKPALISINQIRQAWSLNVDMSSSINVQSSTSTYWFRMKFSYGQNQSVWIGQKRGSRVQWRRLIDQCNCNCIWVSSSAAFRHGICQKIYTPRFSG